MSVGEIDTAVSNAALSAAEPVKPYGYVYESTVRYFDGRSPQRKVDFSYTKKNISDDDIEEFEISETAVYSALSAQVQDVAGWQPIERAPRDGTQFLAFEIGGYFNCWWHDNGYGEQYWMDEADSEPNPTHWMPLPAAPAKQEGKP